MNKVETITGGYGNIGNALMMLNNLLNICINIKCKNIIAPGCLHTIIKRPIFNKEFKITVYPNTFKHKPRLDIILGKSTTFWFGYRKKPHETRFKFIRDEVIRNIPKYISNESDLYINIRSGDIFRNRINHIYSQPPLCFYQKIINENKFSKIFILSNGHENPVIGKLLKLYPGARYIHGKVEFDISVILNAYNFVMPISTFPITLITLNNKLKNLYIYELLKFNTKNADYTVHKMIPSNLYIKVMQRKWKKSKKQLRLMINENCIKSEILKYFKAKGFITAAAHNSCNKEIFDWYNYKYTSFSHYDHENVALFCDPNFEDKNDQWSIKKGKCSILRKCFYDRDSFDYNFEYILNF